MKVTLIGESQKRITSVEEFQKKVTIVKECQKKVTRESDWYLESDRKKLC